MSSKMTRLGIVAFELGRYLSPEYAGTVVFVLGGCLKSECIKLDDRKMKN